MSIQIGWKDGITVDTILFNGGRYEGTIDNEKHTIVVHNGTSPGGTPMSRLDHTHEPESITGLADRISIFNFNEPPKFFSGVVVKDSSTVIVHETVYDVPIVDPVTGDPVLDDEENPTFGPRQQLLKNSDGFIIDNEGTVIFKDVYTEQPDGSVIHSSTGETIIDSDGNVLRSSVIVRTDIIIDENGLISSNNPPNISVDENGRVFDDGELIGNLIRVGYARSDREWVDSSFDILSDAREFITKFLGYLDIIDTHIHTIDEVNCGDFIFDDGCGEDSDKQYARRNGEWSEYIGYAAITEKKLDIINPLAQQVNAEYQGHTHTFDILDSYGTMCLIDDAPTIPDESFAFALVDGVWEKRSRDRDVFTSLDDTPFTYKGSKNALVTVDTFGSQITFSSQQIGNTQGNDVAIFKINLVSIDWPKARDDQTLMPFELVSESPIFELLFDFSAETPQFELESEDISSLELISIHCEASEVNSLSL